MASTRALILELAHEAGFELAGLAPLTPPPAADRFEAWLAAGHHADMTWLSRFRERILDPGRILEGGRSILALGIGHARPSAPTTPGGRVARYAAGRDYHNLVGKRLRKLCTRLRALGFASRTRWVVDAGPLLERSHAAQAGLGFESKATNLLHPVHGPWFFLAEVLLDLELDEAPQAPPDGSCGTCTACLDACPTDALTSPGVLDARLCISYQTIENRGAIPEGLRGKLSGWLFGCDICSEVCPWGRNAPDSSGLFGEHAALARTSLGQLIDLSDDQFRVVFEGSPLRRPGRAGLARNAALLLASAASEHGLEELLRALERDPSPVVREAAAWSLSTGFADDARARKALQARSRVDPDGGVRTRCAQRV